jgi:hypothetical protein
MHTQENVLENLFLIEFLADFKDPNNKRKRRKTTFFRILNAIYLLTKRNSEKGNEHTFPCKALISDVAKVGRTEVTEFITSEYFSLFCSVRRRKRGDGKNDSNVYFLKDWVFQWFRLFWRAGMLKGLHVNYSAWFLSFKKRLTKWLVPLVEGGCSIRQIYEGVVNKLSTKKLLKTAAAKSLKAAAIKPPGVFIKSNEPRDRFFSFQEQEREARALDSQLLSFTLTNSQVWMIRDKYYLQEIKDAVIIRQQWKDSNFAPSNPLAAMLAAIKKVEVRV